MKKLVVFAMAVMMAAVSYGQILGFRPVMHVPDTAAKFPMQMKIGDLVYVKSTHTLYELAVAVGISKNMNYILASASRYNYPSITAASTMAVTTNATVGGYLTVTGKLTTADTVQGAKLKITGNGAVGGTLGVTGATTVTGKLTTADTIQAGKMKITANGSVGGALAVTGKLSTADTIQAAKLKVTANGSVAGALAVTGKLSTADTVQSVTLKTTGNGTVGGTLGVTGLATFTLGAIMTASDTTTKTAGRIVYLNGNFYGANGTYFLKLNN